MWNVELLSNSYVPLYVAHPPAGGGRARYTQLVYFVYAIFNSRHKKIYIGQTEDVEARLKLHNSREFSSSYTSRYDGEWELIYCEKCLDRRSALLREKRLKSFRGREFIRRHIPL